MSLLLVQVRLGADWTPERTLCQSLNDSYVRRVKGFKAMQKTESIATVLGVRSHFLFN